MGEYGGVRAEPDLLIAGGRVLDGTGAPERVASVAVAAGKVAAVGLVAGGAARTVDATGMLVCPGFVDVHTHSDLSLLSAPAAPSRVHQGITTEVVGNCGLGVTPLPDGTDRAALRGAVGYLDLDPAIAWDWRDLPGYLAAVAGARPAVNVAALVAHIPLRAAALGFAGRTPTVVERDRMAGLLGDALDAGGIGLSTGLVYAPASHADDDELAALGAVVAARGKVFAWHVRDYGDRLRDSVAQAVRIGERTGCRVQVSHLIAVGRRNWGGVPRALELIEAAHDRGVDIGVDVYPYLAGSASLFQLVPAWAQEGGGDAMLARLTDPSIRRRIAAALAEYPVGWDEITIGWVRGDGGGVLGRTIAGLAEERGRPPADVVMDLLLAYRNEVTMVAFGRAEPDLLAALRHPLTVIGSDGFTLDPAGPTGAGIPHPRSYGCYPRFLAEYAGRAGLGLAEAVAKCTGRAADRMGLADRGRLAVGYPADLVVLDPERLRDRATFERPHRYPEGIRLVVVNGRVVLDDGTRTGDRPGEILR